MAAFTAAQRDEGLRPDVELYAVAELDPEGLAERLTSWARDGRRVLSDSFSYGGRWRPDWTLDSGPLFWFIGTGVDAHQFTDLRAFAPDLSDPALTPEERAQSYISTIQKVIRPVAFAVAIIMLVYVPLLGLEGVDGTLVVLSLIHISEPTRPY